jgi:hypothetical protein
MNISSFPITKFLKTTCSKNEYWNANEDENEEIDTNSDEDKDDDVCPGMVNYAANFACNINEK